MLKKIIPVTGIAISLLMFVSYPTWSASTHSKPSQAAAKAKAPAKAPAKPSNMRKKLI